MNEIINFLQSNIYVVFAFSFVSIVVFQSKQVIAIVDCFLTLRRLYVSLFLLFSMLVLIIVNSFYRFSPINNDFISAYMIGLSALLASNVAMINMRKSYIDRVIDLSSNVVGFISNVIIRIEYVYSKNEAYKNMLLGNSKISISMLKEYELLFRDILDLLADEKLHRYIDGTDLNLLSKLHGNIFLILSNHAWVVEEVEMKSLNHNIYSQS